MVEERKNSLRFRLAGDTPVCYLDDRKHDGAPSSSNLTKPKPKGSFWHAPKHWMRHGFPPWKPPFQGLTSVVKLRARDIYNSVLLISHFVPKRRVLKADLLLPLVFYSSTE